LSKHLIQVRTADEDTLNDDAKVLGRAADDLCDLGRDELPLGHKRLERAGADDVPERRLGALDERAPDVGDAIGGAVRVVDVPAEDGIDRDRDVVLRSIG
jgi:hypothetical protein